MPVPLDIFENHKEEDHGYETKCWIWQRSIYPTTGYGQARYKGKQTTAHRVAYQVHHGVDLTFEQKVDHLCRVRSCINPMHLEAVSNRENIIRGIGAEVSRALARQSHIAPEVTSTRQRIPT